MISGINNTVSRGYTFQSGVSAGLDDFNAAAKPAVASTPTYSRTTLSGTTPTIDFGAGPVFVLTLTGNTTIAFTNHDDSANYGKEILVRITQSAGGSNTVTWPTSSPSMSWVGGSAPTMTATANRVDIYRLVNDGGVIRQSGLDQNQS